MIRAFVLGCLMLLTGCASQAPLPQNLPTLALPMQLHVQRVQAGQSQDWLLVIQQEGQTLRWSLLDLLGIPQARQRLVEHQWQADGLLPPNPEARELFAALLFALTPDRPLTADYRGATTDNHRRRLGERWQVVYRKEAASVPFTLTLLHDLTYRITPLPSETTP